MKKLLTWFFAPLARIATHNPFATREYVRADEYVGSDYHAICRDFQQVSKDLTATADRELQRLVR